MSFENLRRRAGILILAATPTAIAAGGGAITPDEAQQRLTDGNQRFSTGAATNPRCDEARRAETAEKGQNPLATVLTCSDSRVCAERIFDQGVGDIFTIRVAGNVSDTDEIGTIEYGVGHLHTPLLVVMGHSSCGAVGAVCSGAELDGSLPQLVDNIEPAVRQARKANPAANSELLTARSVEANVFQSIADILSRSGEVRELAKEGKVKVVGAVYDLATGSVRWLGSHPEQSSLVFGKPRSDDPHAGHGGAAAHTAVAGAKATKANGSSHSESGNAGQSTPAGGGHDAVGLPTPQQAFETLRDGNQRFFNGAPQHPHCDKDRLASTAKGQHPYATVLSCADSRVPVERLFDQGIGDVFVVRFAGNVADTDEIASIEYSTGHLGTPLLVVLGHSSCGAVSAVVGNAELHGCLPALVDNIQPAVARARNANPGLGGDPLIAAAIRANVFQSMNDLLANSPNVRKLVEAGKLRIVGGIYDLASGKIEWLSDPLTADGADPKPAAAPSAKPADAPKSSAQPAEPAKDAHGGHDGHGGR